jgi:hypothetical protein
MNKKTSLTGLRFYKNTVVDTLTVLYICLKMKHYVLPFELDYNTGIFNSERQNKN